MMEYPAPRYPRLKRLKSIEALMPKVRQLVNQTWDVGMLSLKPAYGIKTGDKVLFVALSEYDSIVIEAMCRGIREKGARVDLFTIDSTPLGSPEEIAVHEAIALDKDEGAYNYYYTMVTDLIGADTARSLINLEKYDLIIAGMAGPPPTVPIPWRRFVFASLEDFASPLFDFPMELIKLIDEKTWVLIKSCEVLRLTDPEGTDVKWTNYDDKRYPLSDHHPCRPLNIGYGNNSKDDCTGVVAGTLNHLGAFPHCRAYIEGGQVVRVEDGGKYGDVWREKLGKYRNVKLPLLNLALEITIPAGDVERPTFELPAPGLFWYKECALGTIPAVFRLPREGRHECYANMLHDRRRSGYIHSGFGAPIHGQQQLIEAGIPWTHLHIHSLFPTLEGRNDKGEAVRIVDKGHLIPLDDSEVRSLARRFGDPDELLTEAWIPAMPGINVPGDYMEDYGRDPISWMKREADEHPIWID
ncbi:hypothetical protein ACFLV4_07965 [Chloroflexota bacterium]